MQQTLLRKQLWVIAKRTAHVSTLLADGARKRRQMLLTPAPCVTRPPERNMQRVRAHGAPQAHASNAHTSSGPSSKKQTRAHSAEIARLISRHAHIRAHAACAQATHATRTKCTTRTTRAHLMYQPGRRQRVQLHIRARHRATYTFADAGLPRGVRAWYLAGT